MLFRPCYSTLEKQSLVITISPILFSVAIGLQAVGNSKTAPAGPFDYMDLMFEKQDEIHSFADTGKSEKKIFFLKFFIANDTMLIGKLVDIMSQSSKFSKYADEFAKEMVNEENDWLARVDWKYACSVGKIDEEGESHRGYVRIQLCRNSSKSSTI